MSARAEGRCACCGQPVYPTPHGDDAPFCWDCGLYLGDPAEDCDNEDHRR